MRYHFKFWPKNSLCSPAKGSDMSNSIEGAIDIDILAVLILSLTIDNVNSEQFTLPLKLTSQNCHWLTSNWHWFKQVSKVGIAIGIEIALEKQLILTLKLNEEKIAIDIAIEIVSGMILVLSLPLKWMQKSNCYWHCHCHWQGSGLQLKMAIVILTLS